MSTEQKGVWLRFNLMTLIMALMLAALMTLDLDYMLKPEGVVEFHPKDSSKLLTKLTYNVKGLITKELNVEAISQHVADHLMTFESSLAAGSNAIDEHRIMVSCTEFQHQHVSRMLATVAK